MQRDRTTAAVPALLATLLVPALADWTAREAARAARGYEDPAPREKKERTKRKDDPRHKGRRR